MISDNPAFPRSLSDVKGATIVPELFGWIPALVAAACAAIAYYAFKEALSWDEPPPHWLGLAIGPTVLGLALFAYEILRRKNRTVLAAKDGLIAVYREGSLAEVIAFDDMRRYALHPANTLIQLSFPLALTSISLSVLYSSGESPNYLSPAALLAVLGVLAIASLVYTRAITNHLLIPKGDRDEMVILSTPDLKALYALIPPRQQKPEAHVAPVTRELTQGPLSIASEDELRAACTGPSAGVALLINNDWALSEIDNVAMDAHAPAELPTNQPYRRGDLDLGRSSVHGCVHVSPGRHTVVTKFEGSRPPATLSFVLYPGEIFVRRLDREGGRWIPCEDEARIAALVAEKSLTLIDYFDVVAKVRRRAAAALAGTDVALRATEALMSLIARIDAGESPSAMAEDVKKLGAGLVGVPLRFLSGPLATLVSAARERAEAENFQGAYLVLNVGLLVFPGEATLHALLGELMIQCGQLDEGIAHVDQALARERGLDAAWLARARAAKAKAEARPE